MDKAAKLYNKIHKKLDALQETGELVWAQKRQSRNAIYKHIADIYFFYLNHIKSVEALHAVLDHANIQHKKGLAQGQINFGALLRLVWGTDNCSRSDLDTHSRALNAIHQHYQEKPAFYAKDGVAKLVAWIKEQNGINGLAGYKKSKEIEENEDGNELKKGSSIANHKQSSPSQELITKELAKKSKGFFAALPVTAPIPAPVVKSQIQTNQDNLGLLLVRHTKSGFDIIGSSKNSDAISLVKAETYRRSTAGFSLGLRCIIETLKTQCLPSYLQRLQKEIIDKGIEKATKDDKPKAHRRMLYIGAHNQYLLSPTNARSGVVTICTPTTEVFLETDDDLKLSYRARTRLEQTLISNNEFNLYQLLKPHKPYDYPESNSLAYVARLENSISPNYNFMHLDFWRYEVGHKPLHSQLYGHPVTAEIIWQISLNKKWFQELAYNVLDLWLEGSGGHMKRQEHKVCRLTFSDTSIKFEFTKKSALSFAISREVEFETPIKKRKVMSSHFLPKDIVPALRCIADLDLEGEAVLKLTESVLCIEYKTAAAEYMVIIPRTSDTGIRSHKYFDQYTPKQFISFEQEHEIEDDEQEYEE